MIIMKVSKILATKDYNFVEEDIIKHFLGVDNFMSMQNNLKICEHNVRRGEMY